MASPPTLSETDRRLVAQGRRSAAVMCGAAGPRGGPRPVRCRSRVRGRIVGRQPLKSGDGQQLGVRRAEDQGRQPGREQPPVRFKGGRQLESVIGAQRLLFQEILRAGGPAE